MVKFSENDPKILREEITENFFGIPWAPKTEGAEIHSKFSEFIDQHGLSEKWRHVTIFKLKSQKKRNRGIFLKFDT
jgi:hypothetical protein